MHFIDANMNKFNISRDLRFMSLLMEEEESNVEFFDLIFILFDYDIQRCI